MTAAGTRSAPNLVAVHQPNFLPWLGFFDKLSRVSTFVLMDNVQLPRSGRGSWVNRVRIMVEGEPRWATVPLLRPHGELQVIADVEIDESTDWRSKILRTVKHSYVKAPHFGEVFPWLENVIGAGSNRIADYNRHAIFALADLVGLDTGRIVVGSTLPSSGSGTDLLVSLVNAVGGTGYLCGAGASNYQEDDKFERAGLDLVRQDFEHPTYPQVHGGAFEPGLSIIDVLLNAGVEWTREFFGRTAPVA